MKRLLKFIVGLVVLVILGVVGVFFYLDVIAKSAIERGSTYALGVETKLDSADVQVFRGGLALKKLNVHNPKGFSTAHFLDLKNGQLEVTFNSLRQDVVHVPLFRLVGADINLEKQAAGANYQIILDSLKRLQGDPNQPGKRFIIDRLVIRNVTVHADVLGAIPGASGIGGGEATRVTVPVDEVRLRDIGKQDGRGVTISELSGIVLKAMLASAVKNGANLLPADIEGELRGKLAELADFDRLLEDIDLGDLEQKAGELGVPKDITEKAKDKIGDLLGGQKKD